jgi:signal recognition particle subunit SRP54
MFGRLTDRLSEIFNKLRGKAMLCATDVDQALRDIRIALLEADVALSVAKNFIESIREQAIGKEVLRSLSPVEQLVKIVHDRLVKDLSHEAQGYLLEDPLKVSSVSSKYPVECVLVVGLQGSGKTTMCSKIAQRLKKEGKRVLMASVDVYRPAAQEQLATLGQQILVDTLPIIVQEKPLAIAQRALRALHGKDGKGSYDVLILDTAGRLQVDDMLMKELKDLEALLKPTQTFFVADVLAGQDMAKVIEVFQQTLPITGCCLSRVDADSRGGVALSLRVLTGTPLKLLGTGERPDQSDLFDAQRFARRILDMGDIVALAEKASTLIEKEEAQKQMDRLQKGIFTLEDFRSQLNYLEKLGGLGSILGFLPGLNKAKKWMEKQDTSKSFKEYKALIGSMTRKERYNPSLLDASRKRRIAKGSGSSVQSLNQLLEHFQSISQMMKTLGKVVGKMAQKNSEVLFNPKSSRADLPKKLRKKKPSRRR